MKLSLDADRFDELQMHLICEIIADIRSKLIEAGITDHDKLFEVTGKMSFAIAVIVDGSRNMDLDGTPVLPVLTFAKNSHFEELICAERGSFMHEYVFGCLDDVFESEGDV